MLFNSYVFMLAFLPLTLLGYFLLGRLPEKNQLNKVFLVLASFLFYGYNNPSYVPIIAGSILVNYALSQLMLTREKKAVRLPLMLLGLFLNLGVLFYFKYHDFFFENLNGAFGLSLDTARNTAMTYFPSGAAAGHFVFYLPAAFLRHRQLQAHRSALQYSGLCAVRHLLPPADRRADRAAQRNRAAVCGRAKPPFQF